MEDPPARAVLVLMRIGLVARFKPVHLGHAAMLEALCEQGSRVTIGLGSPNRFDRRNPFTASESAEMIERVLGPRFSNFELLLVPDLGDGPRWAEQVHETMGPLDIFVTANPWVAGLLLGRYRIVHPAVLVPKERHVAVDATAVRAAMALGEGWRSLVPPEVEHFLDERGLVSRFRRDFGLETLAASYDALVGAGR